MKRVSLSLAAAAFLLPAGVSMAQSLPEPLRPIGNLSSPFNLIIPNYNEAPLPSSWQGFYVKPSIGYNSVSFSGRGGNELRGAKGLTLGASVALPKMPIPGMGWLAYLKDTEGNVFGMMQMDPKAT